jgi:hypothetical protein
VQYALPKALLRLQLVNNSGALSLEVSQPFFVGDPSATYVMSTSSSLTSDQQALFVVEPQTRLLSYVNSSSAGRTGDILQNLIRSIAGVGAAPSDLTQSRTPTTTQGIVYARVVDPFMLPGCDFGTTCDFAPISQELRAAAIAYVCESGNSQGANSDLCARLNNQADFFRLRLEPLFTLAPASTTVTPRDRNVCARSVCYRTPAPYALSVSVGGRTNVSDILSFPNEAPAMSVRMRAGIFATSRARMELYKGMPARYVVDHQNELVQITLVPFNIVKAGLGAVSDVVRLRINYNNDWRDEYQSERSRTEASSELGISQAPTPPVAEPLTSDLYGDSNPEPSSDPYPRSPNAPTAAVGDEQTMGSALSATQLFSIPLSGSGASQSVGQ